MRSTKHLNNGVAFFIQILIVICFAGTVGFIGRYLNMSISSAAIAQMIISSIIVFGWLLIRFIQEIKENKNRGFKRFMLFIILMLKVILLSVIQLYGIVLLRDIYLYIPLNFGNQLESLSESFGTVLLRDNIRAFFTVVLGSIALILCTFSGSHYMKSRSKELRIFTVVVIPFLYIMFDKVVSNLLRMIVPGLQSSQIIIACSVIATLKIFYLDKIDDESMN